MNYKEKNNLKDFKVDAASFGYQPKAESISGPKKRRHREAA